jgi:hypothetical protein
VPLAAASLAARTVSVPTGFRPEAGLARPGVRPARTLLRRGFGFDPIPAEEVVEAFAGDMWRREAWYAEQMAGRKAAFEATSSLCR